jgi:asparagine synthase (glutamine-hydrolysing)
MCGICGAINTRKRVADESHVQRMVAVLSHRGPDDARVVTAGDVVLGHSRLSIIDLSGGAQPMASHDGRFWIAFNGEIFNYVELRSELKLQGAAFRTHSDTEVILEAYREWGTECFSRFNGQWAIALWDRQCRSVVLSRDRVGIRPLYYTEIDGTYLFASEVKALLCHPSVPRQLDPTGLNEAFTFWAPVAPTTAFAGIRQLEPGTYATIRQDSGSFSETAYWRPDFGVDESIRKTPLEENAERFRETLVSAAQLRFDRSDVPVGAYLSGGIDSAVISAIIAEYTDATLQTYSVSFADPQFDESEYQDLVADRLGTEHRRVVVRADEISRTFPEVVWHAEQPIVRTAPGPLYALSGLVRETGLKVVVTGEGSDEILAGYDLFRELYPWMQRSPTKVPAFAHAFFTQAADPSDPGLSHRPRWRMGASLLRMLNPEFGDQVNEDVAGVLLSRLPTEYSKWYPLEQAQYLEIKTLLSGYILAAQGDRMLMSHSVEGRFPFLDHNVMEMAFSLLPEQKLKGLDEKHILKAAFGDLVPQEVMKRPKQPYRAPGAASFFSGAAQPEWLTELLSERSLTEAGVFDPGAVTGLVRKCRSRKGGDMSNTDNMRAVAVVSTMLLHDRFIKRPATPDCTAGAEEIPVTRLAEKAIDAST